jgi:DNA-directed RNA polymerase subunit E'/Rpb7
MIAFEVFVNDKLLVTAGEPKIEILTAFIRNDFLLEEDSIMPEEIPSQSMSIGGSWFKSGVQHSSFWTDEVNGSLQVGDVIRIRFVDSKKADKRLRRQAIHYKQPSLREYKKLKARYLSVEQELAAAQVKVDARRWLVNQKPFVAFEASVNGKLVTVAGGRSFYALVAIVMFNDMRNGDFSFRLDFAGFSADAKNKYNHHWRGKGAKSPRLSIGDEITIRIIETDKATRCTSRSQSTHLEDLQREFERVKEAYLSARKIHEPEAV